MGNHANKIDVRTWKQKCEASEDFYGLFFEDINRSGDGGLYPEMIRNRSFEDGIPPKDVRTEGEDNAIIINENGWPDVFNHGEGIPHWTKDLPYTPIPAWYAHNASMALSDDTLNRWREAALLVTFFKGGSVHNVGYAGVPAEAGKSYDFYCFAASKGISMTVSLEGEDGTVYAKELLNVSGGYARYDAVLTASASDPKARLVFRADEGEVLFGFTSLMPQETFCGHGLRKDLCEMLAGFSPKFLRFPGGCIVEGFTRSTAMRFSHTIGPVWERPSHQLVWHYRASNGLGFHEYLQLCEDLGVAALYVCNVGLTCQARAATCFEGEELNEMLQETFDALEYAMGSEKTHFGKMRARMGHPAPFPIRYIEIGNENSGAEYFPRYLKFYEAIKARYPDIILISNTHTEQEGLPTEIADEHYYDVPNFFSEHADMFDAYPRSGPKIFLGEYATVGGEHVFNLNCALHESSWLLGAERNQDVVKLTAFAPLFQHVNFTAWAPNLIIFDNHRAYGIPTYHALSILGKYHGKEVVDTQVETGTHCLGFTGYCGIQCKEGLRFRSVRVNGAEAGIAKRIQNDAEEKDGVYTAVFGGEGEVTMTNIDGEINALWGKKMREFQLKYNRQIEATSRRDVVSLAFGEQIRTGTYEIEVFCDEGTSFDLSLWNRLFIEPYGIDEPKLKGWSLRATRNVLWEIDNGRGSVRQRRFFDKKREEDFVPLPVRKGEFNLFRVELEADRFRCYVNGEFVQEGLLPRYHYINAAADVDGDAINLKIVNLSDKGESVEISLDCDVEPCATGEVLTGDPLDQNTFEHPEHVSAKQIKAEAGRNFVYAAPAHSLTALRLKKI